MKSWDNFSCSKHRILYPVGLERIETTAFKTSVFERCFTQIERIFPITKKFSPRNATATNQRFCLVDGKFYNSTKTKDAIADVTNEADKKFLEECFKVGYYFAFGKEATSN